MDLGPLTIQIRFPGAAGRYQDAGATASFIRELGDGYERYHAFLANALEALGGRPEPADYGKDVVGYYRDSDRFADIIVAEVLLRRCRAFRRTGRRLDDPDFDDPTTLDERHRLVSVETRAPSSRPLPSGDPAPHYWERPPSPPER
jgi:hypothetical protein